MNSRDAAFEEQVQAALEASKREAMMPNGQEEIDVGDEGIRRLAEDDEEGLELEPAQEREGKRKREDDDSGGSSQPSAMAMLIGTESVEPFVTPAPGSGKPKHPNQYTYRPRPPPSATQAPPNLPSPVRKGIQGGTPIPALPPPAQHEHGTRRAGAIANGTIPAPNATYSVSNLQWHLPDHLLGFSDLLPTSSPIAIEVRTPRVLPFLPKNHFHSQRYGPFSEDRDADGKLLLPNDPPAREPIGQPSTHLEPPARIRYPAKRITTAEMRNVLDYVGRVKGEEGKRKGRAKILGIEVRSLLTLPPVNGKVHEEEAMMVDGDTEATKAKSEPPTATQLIDDLTRDLLAYQETFAQGGFASKFPPPIPTFPAQPPITLTLPPGLTMSYTNREVGDGGDVVEHAEQNDAADFCGGR